MEDDCCEAAAGAAAALGAAASAGPSKCECSCVARLVISIVFCWSTES